MNSNRKQFDQRVEGFDYNRLFNGYCQRCVIYSNLIDEVVLYYDYGKSFYN